MGRTLWFFCFLGLIAPLASAGPWFPGWGWPSEDSPPPVDDAPPTNPNSPPLFPSPVPPSPYYDAPPYDVSPPSTGTTPPFDSPPFSGTTPPADGTPPATGTTPPFDSPPYSGTSPPGGGSPPASGTTPPFDSPPYSGSNPPTDGTPPASGTPPFDSPPYSGTTPPADGTPPFDSPPYSGTTPPSDGTPPFDSPPYSGGPPSYPPTYGPGASYVSFNEISTSSSWSDNLDKWPAPWTATSTVDDAFGKDAEKVYGQVSLFDGLMSKGDDGYSKLLKEGVCALLNSSDKKFQFSEDEVKDSFKGALTSETTAGVQALNFENANKAYGDNF